MKEAAIQPHTPNAVVQALHGLPHLPGLTADEVARALHRAAHTGRTGDGSVVSRPAETVVRVPTHPDPNP